MLARLVVVGSLLLATSACRIETDPSKLDAGKKDEPIDLNALVSRTECKERCAAKLEACGDKEADANKDCNSICVERATGHQMVCLEGLGCDLSHEETVTQLCPEATKDN